MVQVLLLLIGEGDEQETQMDQLALALQEAEENLAKARKKSRQEGGRETIRGPKKPGGRGPGRGGGRGGHGGRGGPGRRGGRTIKG